MNSNINLAFNNCKKERRPALITYTVAGDNSKTNSLKIINSIIKFLNEGFDSKKKFRDDS